MTAPLLSEGSCPTSVSSLPHARRQIDFHGTEALAGCKRGRKPKQDAKDLRIDEPEKRTAKLETKLSLVGKLLDLQKLAFPAHRRRPSTDDGRIFFTSAFWLSPRLIRSVEVEERDVRAQKNAAVRRTVGY